MSSFKMLSKRPHVEEKTLVWMKMYIVGLKHSKDVPHE
jgi:hypothetical protein